MVRQGFEVQRELYAIEQHFLGNAGLSKLSSGSELAAIMLAIMRFYPKLASLPASASKHRHFQAVFHIVAPLQGGRHKAALVARAATHVLQVAPQAALRKHARVVRHHQRPGSQRWLRRLLRD